MPYSIPTNGEIQFWESVMSSLRTIAEEKKKQTEELRRIHEALAMIARK